VFREQREASAFDARPARAAQTGELFFGEGAIEAVCHVNRIIAALLQSTSDG